MSAFGRSGRSLVPGLYSLKRVANSEPQKPPVYEPRLAISFTSSALTTEIAARCLRCAWSAKATIGGENSLRSAVKGLKSLHPSCQKKVVDKPHHNP